MRLTKLGHSCILIEHPSARILVDPGIYTEISNLPEIDAILITHEHPDHCSVEKLKLVFNNSPDAVVVANESCGKVLKSADISFSVASSGVSFLFGKLKVECIEAMHNHLHSSVARIENTAYFIGEKLLVTGDSFDILPKQVEILALPVCGPWMKLSEAIDFALMMKPKACFPVHDGMIMKGRLGPIYSLPKELLGKAGIEFYVLEPDFSKDF